MAFYPDGLTVAQWCREGTPGVDAATTSKIIATEFNAVPMDEVYRPALIQGLLLENPGNEQVIKRWSEITISGPLSYEQAQNLFAGVLGNDAAPTGSGDPYTWELTRDPAGVPSVATYTIERRITDGSTPIQQAWHYCCIRELTITFADGEPVTYSATLFGRRVQTETLTASQSLPTPEWMPLGVGKMWIDTTWAGLGTTVVATQVTAGSVTFRTGLQPAWTLDQRADLDYSAVSNGRLGIEASITAKVGAQYATEKTAAEAQTLRAVRLQFDGSTSRQLLLDILVKHAGGSIFDFGIDDQGDHNVTMPFVGSTDKTNVAQATVINAVSAYA
jgi:hypothetical protein